MRILILSNLYPPNYLGGYELNCNRVASALKRRGHEVSVLTSDHGQSDDAVASPEPGVERSLRINGYYGHPWLGIRHLCALELHNNTMLRRAVARHRPDLVYVWNMGGISKSLILSLQELNVPCAFYVSDHWIARSLTGDVWLDWWNRERTPLPSRLLRAMLTWTGLRKKWSSVAPTTAFQDLKFHRLTFCSRALRSLTVAKGYDVAHAGVIHCHVDTRQFQGPAADGSRPMTRLLYVGRLAEDKGVMCALRAMALLKDRFAGELHVYGKGDALYTEALHAFVREHGLPVAFHSASDDQMPEVYRNHDALLFTSEWEEPFALTPLEAMASGLPVIGTTTGGSAELFRDGVNALTYVAADADMLASQILRLDADPSLRARVAAQGQRTVRELCSEGTVVDQIESYLTETVAKWDVWSSGRFADQRPPHHRDTETTLLPVPA